MNMKKIDWVLEGRLICKSGGEPRGLVYEPEGKSVTPLTLEKEGGKGTKFIPYSCPGLGSEVKHSSKWPKAIVGHILPP